MANTFKQTPYDGTSLAADTDATVYTAPSGNAADVGIIIGLMVSNLVSSEIKVIIKLVDSSNSSAEHVILNAVPIPPNTTLELMTGNKIVLESADAFKAQSDTANSMNVFVSSLEITV